ncbi:MAG: GNAT family N-acetyltransferase [Bacteriovoracaceae bacterium]|nr:GNAT family N-acetyltransferase [Bacteriovoracaceae bacterium]
MEIFLKTERVILRYFKPEDKELLRDLDSDPEVMRFLSNGNPSDEKEVTRAITVIMELNDKTDGKYGYWIALEKQTNNFMGWFQLRPLKTDPENYEKLELGYRLKREFWGRGYATEVSKALIDRAFKVLGSTEVWALTHHKNLGSRKVMEKCGLSYKYEEPYEPYPDPDNLVVYYALSKAQWSQKT